jgi:predicted RNA-binding Zn ribbon-like protein
MRSYADLVAWGAMVGLLDSSEANRLRAAGERRASDAEAVLARAIDLRAAIARVFTAIAEDGAPAEDDLATLDREYGAAMAHTRLTATPGGYELTWSDENTALDWVLWPVARSAVELLVEGDPGRVKQCPGPDGGCGWLFYDVSKNRSRHWCSMEGCGSQAKMQRYRKRLRSKSEEIP